MFILEHCHRVLTQLQLTNISISIYLSNDFLVLHRRATLNCHPTFFWNVFSVDDKICTGIPPPYHLEYRKPYFRWTIVKFACMMELRILHRQNLRRQQILPNNWACSTFRCGQLLFASLYLAFNFIIRRTVPSFSQTSLIIWNAQIFNSFHAFYTTFSSRL